MGRDRDWVSAPLELAEKLVRDLQRPQQPISRTDDVGQELLPRYQIPVVIVMLALQLKLRLHAGDQMVFAWLASR
ncbi:MAG: hypothetical protein JST54_29100 [Deltaproteobacteria bacterium]|nr:hypothetical protein [Deltaproteobacteria bacterium]